MRLRAGIALAIGGVLLGIAFWWLFIAESPIRPVLRPETGYRVPDAADIKGIWITDYPTAEVHRGRYEVARQYWDEILRNLSPSEQIVYESGEASPSLSVMATIRIQLGLGAKTVDLFDEGPVLIFCPRAANKYYYAGARGAAMTQVLADAFAHARLKAEETEAEPDTLPAE